MKKNFIKISAFVFTMMGGLLQADSNPTMSRVYGNQFTPQVADTQSAATIGTLDTTFDTDGILSVNAVLSGGRADRIEALSDGTFLAVVSKATVDSAVAKYNAEGVLQTYGTAGVAALGSSNETELSLASMLDTQGRILVAGGATTGWLARLSTAGDSLTTFSAYADGTWTKIAGLAQQSTGQIIAVGLNKDGTPHGQIARYNLDGTLDTDFVSSGYLKLDGSGVLPTVETHLVSVVVDSSDRIHVAFIAAATANSFTADDAYIARFTAAGALDTSEDDGWPAAGFTALADLDAAISGLHLAQNYDGNFIVGARVGVNAKVTGVTSAGGAIGGFATFNSSTISSNTFEFFNLITTSDDSIFIIGSDVTDKKMAVIRLVGATGILDTAFNTTGYNFFNVSSPDTTAQLQAATVATDGQIYTAGHQVDSATSTPYVARLNNTQYVSRVDQFPSSQEQGILDQVFGTQTSQTYAGVTVPFNGLYGSSLMQKAQSMVEVTTTSGVAAGVPTVGDILVGMNGFTNTSASQNMMLSWLDSTGDIDTAVNSSGYLTLANSLTNEYLTSILQGPSGLVYVAGYSSTTVGGASTGVLLRAYSTSSTTTWTSGVASWSAVDTAANYKATAVGYQASATRTLLFVSEDSPATLGHITAYNVSGSVDTGFGDTSSGTIDTDSYGLNMGPCYGGLITAGDNLIVGYQDSSDDTTRVVEFAVDGSALNTAFGTSGKSAALFSGVTGIDPNNIRISFNSNDDIVVAAVNAAGTSLLFTLLDAETGDVDTNFGTSGVLTVAITGSTSLLLKQITGISDGKTLVTFYDNATDDTMYLSRITLLGALDTTFNSQGSIPGLLPVQIGDEVTNYNARVATAALVQSASGNIVMSGYESVTANDATPMVMRSYGQSGTTEVPYYPVTDTGTPGTLDVAYNLNSLLGTAAGKVIFTYPGNNTYQGKILVGYDNGTTSLVARIDISTNTLDTTFGSSGIYTILGSLTGISNISIDAEDNVLVGGAKSGAGWAQVLNANATSTTLFDLTTTASDIASVSQILQQKSGRYIVSGTQTTSGNGILVAFQDKLVGAATKFAVDPTFNPLSVGSVTYAGSYYVGTTGVYSIAINSDDTLLAVYKNTVLAVNKITADGSGLVSGFGSSGVLTTTITPDSSSVSRVNIDSAGKVVVAASSGTGTQVQAQRFTSAGAADTTWNTTGAIITVNDIGTAGVTLSTLLETTDQQTVLIGYNTDGSLKLFASRLASDGILDTTWNSGSSLTYDSNSATAMNDATITISGLIASIGQQTGGTAGDPILTYVYGDTYITEVSQNPLEAAAGTLDSTIPGNASGALALASTLTGVPQKVYVYNSTINSSPNGAMLVASKVDATGTVYITQLNADLSLNSNFGSSGVISFTPNSTTTPTSVFVTDMYVANDTAGDEGVIYITGYTRTSGGVNTAFTGKVASDGSGTITEATPVSTLTATTTSPVSGGVRQSSNGRVLVSGYDGSLGTIAAYNSEMTAIDTSFATSGYYATAIDNPIVAMTIDTLDRIYIAYKSSATVIAVVRLLENGTVVDSDFSATFITGTAYSATQIKMAIDLTNSQLIVAAQDGTGAANTIQLKRFALVDGTAAGNISTITVADTVLNVSDLFIDNDSTGSAYPNIYVVGYTNSGNSVVARVATTSTTIALDTTYATTGIANLTIGSSTMSVVTAAALDPDRRVYMVGSNGTTAGYMGRFFGDYYWTERYPAITQATVGTVDSTLSPTGATTGVAGLNIVTQIAAWSGLPGYTARAVIENQNADGSAFIAFGNATNLIVGKVNADMNAATYGTAGLTTALAMATVNSMTQDADGNIIVVGTTGAGAQKVVSFDTDGVLNATFAASTIASSVGTAVAQQKSGRYIVGGLSSTYAMISAYKNESAIDTAVLPVDNTFGPDGLNGYYLNEAAASVQVDDLCVDSNDFIYYVYRGGSNQIYLSKLTANGSGTCTSVRVPAGDVFNTSGADVATGITATQPARIAINSAGNILIGASTSAGISTRLYTPAGAAVSATLAQTLSNTPVLTQLVGAGTAAAPGAGTEFYGSYYNSATTAGAYVFAITNAGILDTIFNSGVVLALTGQTPSLTAGINGLSVQADGKVVAVGYDGTDPILMRAYAYPYVAQFAQAPDQVDAGVLDTTLWESGVAATDGIFPFSTIDSGLATAITDMGIVRVFEDGNGVMTFVATKSDDTVVFRLLKDLTLDTSFSTDGYISFGAGSPNANSLYINSVGDIFVTGNDGGSWIWGMASDSSDISPNFAPGSDLLPVYEIAQQTNGRVIAAGLDTNGTLIGYTSTGTLDNSFGSGGSVDMGSAIAITDLAIDSYDNIITVSNNSGTVVLQKVTASGLTVTDVSSTGTAITGAVGNVKVALDAEGNIVVAAATATGYIIKNYVNDNATPANTGTDIGSVTITTGTTPVLSNMYATTGDKINFIGYDSNNGAMVVGRLTSTSGGLALDTASFNASTGYLSTLVGDGSDMDLFLDGIIHADDRMMVVGSNSGTAAPYMTRVFGDEYYTYVAQAEAQAVVGTLDTTFGDTNPPTGIYDVATLNALLGGAQGKAILPLSNGGYYMAFDLANTLASSILVKTVADGSLDTAYNTGGSVPGLAGTDTGTYAPLGINGILEDGLSKVLLVGTTGGAGWLRRYTSAGVKDTDFGTAGAVAVGTAATVAVEQTPARYVVAGSNGSYGTLFAYTAINPSATPGSVDTTFNAGSGGTPGYVATTSTNAIYNIIADQYDRLIFALLNSTTGNTVDLYRMTPTGELDYTFGTSGIVAGALTAAADASSVRVAFDAAGNIIVAATSTTTNTFSVAAYDNGVSTVADTNGAEVNAQLDVAALTAPSVTSLVTSADGYTLILGTQSGTGAAWIARITAGGALDTTFNPNALGGTAGIFQYSAGGGDTSPAHVYNGLAVNVNGTLGMVGYETTTGPVYAPSLVAVYNDPFTSQESQSQDSKAVGTNDTTLGVNATSAILNAVDNGVTFFGTSDATVGNGQVAQSIALFDDSNLVVAMDGGATAGDSTYSSIFINMFDNDGLLNPDFGTSGQATVLTGSASPSSPNYQNQYVRDMVKFTAGGVNKAIIAGYTYNSALPTANQYSSLLLQYKLVPGGTSGLDTANFGGFNGSPQGLAFGDAKQAFSVGQQSTGRIIVGGLSQDDLGVLLGYTAAGKLDTSFGVGGGYQSTDTGSTGIYSHAVDTKNRIAFVYNASGSVQVARMLADGSDLDATFVTPTPLISTVISNSDMKVALDSSNNVIVAAITASGNTIAVNAYDDLGGTATQTSTITGTALGNASAVYVMSKLLVDTEGNVIVVAYDSNAETTVVVRLVVSGSAYILDTTFNTTGYITYQVNGELSNAKDAMIHPDGRIIVVGSGEVE